MTRSLPAMTRKRALQGGASAAVVLLLVWLGSRVAWGPILAALQQADPVLVVGATLASLGSLCLKAAAWWVFLRPLGVGSGLGPLRSTFAGAALNNVLPWNAGDAVRVWALAAQERVPLLHVVGTAGLERLTGLASGILLLGFAWFFVPLAAGSGWLGRAGGLTVGLLMASLFLIPTRWVRFAAVSRLGKLAGRPLAAAWPLGVHRRELVLGTALGGAAWLLQLAAYIMAAAAVGLSPGFTGHLLLLVTVNLGFIVRLTPGGVGVFQAVYVATAVVLGLPETTALASAILLQALQVIPITILGGILVPSALRTGPRGPTASAIGPDRPDDSATRTQSLAPPPGGGGQREPGVAR
jgi:glycosyltransferase 2 family protein